MIGDETMGVRSTLFQGLKRIGYPEDGSRLGDFTTTWRLLTYLSARPHDRSARCRHRLVAAPAHRVVHQSLLLPALGYEPGNTQLGHPGTWDHHRPDDRRAHRWPNGPLRLRADTGTWNPRGNRSDPHSRQPDPAARRGTEAALFGDLDRLRWAVRCRRADRDNRWCAGLTRHPVLPPDQRRASYAARGRSSRRDDGGFRHPCDGGAAGSRAPALRVEASQHGPGGPGCGDGPRDPPVDPRLRSALSDLTAPCVCIARLPHWRSIGRPARWPPGWGLDRCRVRC
mgnify:CR=1 FL=1